jgi:SAM-dependent methyltransferase
MNDYPEGVELEDRPCPLGCAPNDISVLKGQDLIHGIPGRYHVVRCACCDLMRTNPRPTSETIGAYYPTNYGPYVSTPVFQTTRPSGWKHQLKKLIGFENKRIPDIAPGRLLEIGCASGSYLAEMRSLEWKVEGIEFSDSVAQDARAKGIEVQSATVEDAVDPKQCVDVVAAWMVLEHLHEPIKALKRIHTWIKPEGYLVGSVPDASCVLGRLFGNARYELQLPTHLYHFTPKTLEDVLCSAGWELDRIYWQKNCNNLLWSLEYVAVARGWKKFASAVGWFRTSNQAGKLRLVLGWILGITKQSGRIEFWARPK